MNVAAELAHSAVPIDAAANVGNDVNASAVGPTDMNPNAVVDTTSAESRALDNSARFETVDFGGGGKDVVAESLLLLFVASFAFIDSDPEIFLAELLFSSSLLFDVVEEEKNEM